MKTFANLKEAQEALKTTILTLNENRDTLNALLAQCGDNQQLKMTTLIPKLQELLGGALAQHGFPPGGPGIMQGFMAFQGAIAAEAQSGGSTIKSGLDMLQKAMMGNLPGQPAVDAAVAQLQ